MTDILFQLINHILMGRSKKKYLHFYRQEGSYINIFCIQKMLGLLNPLIFLCIKSLKSIYKNLKSSNKVKNIFSVLLFCPLDISYEIGTRYVFTILSFSYWPNVTKKIVWAFCLNKVKKELAPFAVQKSCDFFPLCFWAIL